MLSACIDANVYISALAFGGKPAKVIQLALLRQYHLVTSMHILNEVRRNLTTKLEFTDAEVTEMFRDIISVADIYKPTGLISYIPHKQDNLVLETAILGNVDVLVTGDKKDLLPLQKFNNIIIEPPSAFLARLELP